jgi:hypothetical protein
LTLVNRFTMLYSHWPDGDGVLQPISSAFHVESPLGLPKAVGVDRTGSPMPAALSFCHFAVLSFAILPFAICHFALSAIVDSDGQETGGLDSRDVGDG